MTNISTINESYSRNPSNNNCQPTFNCRSEKPDEMVTLVGYKTPGEFEDGSRSGHFKNSNYAVAVKNLDYCHRGSRERVLNGLNMTVPLGSIYGLTGSSGCGKTTLISCFLGIQKYSDGQIFLYGCLSDSRNRHKFVDIPGRDVGYMPQSISLYSMFTIYEILAYFGQLYGMKTFDIVEKSQELLELLQLNQPFKRIETLSGGQQRRVSFAVALIHSPKLLVLDEPTVGMDPVLRIRIWNHLKRLVKEFQTTVIITSHYLDEMRKADKIGIMRKGKIMVENSPENLLSLCNVENLDDAILTLCKDTDQCNSAQNYSISGNECILPHPCNHEESPVNVPNIRNPLTTQIKVLVRKNISTLLRNIPLFIFVICIPTIQLFTVLIVGHEPTKLKLGVVNEELAMFPSTIFKNDSYLEPESSCPHNATENLLSCNLRLLSCSFQRYISTSKVSLSQFSSKEDAIYAVETGLIYGYIKFSSNFSTSLVDRALLEHTSNSTNETETMAIFELSSIIAQFDQSNTIVYRLLLSELYKSQEMFLTSLLSSCGANPHYGEYPLQYQSPIFGKADDFSFTEYGGTAGVIPFMFFYPIISSGFRFIEERNNGMMERTLFTGVKFSHILISFLITELLQVTLQSSLIYSLLYYWVPMHNVETSAKLFAFILIMLSGYTGVSLGLLLGSLCTEQLQVAIIALSLIIPNILLSGIVWPLDAMSELVRTLVGFLPCTFPGLAVRYIWLNGLNLTHSYVWPGFVVLLIYIPLLNFLTLIRQKLTK